jgi:Domain of unknown function (DUF4129)
MLLLIPALRVVGSPAPSPPIGGAAARAAAREELRKAMYHRDDPGLVDRLLNWLGRRVGGLFDGTASGSAALVLLALLAAVVVFAVFRAGRPRRMARAAPVADPLAPHAGIDHRRLAAELAGQGRLAEALREWLRAAVRTIEDRGVLDPRPGRTGGEIARAAGLVLPSAAARLRAATRAFDEVWFGERAATDADVAAGREAADAVRDARVAQQTEVAGYAVPR